MTNDIRKNIMLIESIILDESFKDAQAKFSTTANPDEVKSYIEKFKELSKRNIIKGQDKDIGFWIKGDWVDFKKFVDSNSTVVTKRQSKVEQKKDSIVVYKDDNKQVVIPLTQEASIQYGKNTAWCTAYYKSSNHFVGYFYGDKVTLFYVLFADGKKYACVFHPEQSDKIKCFDQADKIMSFTKFKKATGISMKDIQNWYNSNKIKIEDSRDLDNASEEFQIAVVNGNSRAIEYIDNPSEKVKLAAVTEDGRAIEYIDNPSEEIQLAAVKNYGRAIMYIVDNGIVPSEEVQLAAITENGDAIKYIIKKGIVPSEELQLAAVTSSRYAIEHIDNPSEKVKELHKKLWEQ